MSNKNTKSRWNLRSKNGKNVLSQPVRTRAEARDIKSGNLRYDPDARSWTIVRVR